MSLLRYSSMLHYRVCSTAKYLIVVSPTAPNSSYEEIDLKVVVEYSGPRLINSSRPLQFRYAGNPDINAIEPKRIRNRFVYFVFPIFIRTKDRPHHRCILPVARTTD